MALITNDQQGILSFFSTLACEFQNKTARMYTNELNDDNQLGTLLSLLLYLNLDEFTLSQMCEEDYFEIIDAAEVAYEIDRKILSKLNSESQAAHEQYHTNLVAIKQNNLITELSQAIPKMHSFSQLTAHEKETLGYAFEFLTHLQSVPLESLGPVEQYQKHYRVYHDPDPIKTHRPFVFHNDDYYTNKYGAISCKKVAATIYENVLACWNISVRNGSLISFLKDVHGDNLCIEGLTSNAVSIVLEREKARNRPIPVTHVESLNTFAKKANAFLKRLDLERSPLALERVVSHAYGNSLFFKNEIRYEAPSIVNTESIAYYFKQLKVSDSYFLTDADDVAEIRSQLPTLIEEWRLYTLQLFSTGASLANLNVALDKLDHINEALITYTPKGMSLLAYYIREQNLLHLQYTRDVSILDKILQNTNLKYADFILEYLPAIIAQYEPDIIKKIIITFLQTPHLKSHMAKLINIILNACVDNAELTECVRHIDWGNHVKCILFLAKTNELECIVELDKMLGQEGRTKVFNYANLIKSFSDVTLGLDSQLSLMFLLLKSVKGKAFLNCLLQTKTLNSFLLDPVKTLLLCTFPLVHSVSNHEEWFIPVNHLSHQDRITLPLQQLDLRFDQHLEEKVQDEILGVGDSKGVILAKQYINWLNRVSSYFSVALRSRFKVQLKSGIDRPLKDLVSLIMKSLSLNEHLEFDNYLFEYYERISTSQIDYDLIRAKILSYTSELLFYPTFNKIKTDITHSPKFINQVEIIDKVESLKNISELFDYICSPDKRSIIVFLFNHSREHLKYLPFRYWQKRAGNFLSALHFLMTLTQADSIFSNLKWIYGDIFSRLTTDFYTQPLAPNTPQESFLTSILENEPVLKVFLKTEGLDNILKEIPFDVWLAIIGRANTDNYSKTLLQRLLNTPARRLLLDKLFPPSDPFISAISHSIQFSRSPEGVWSGSTLIHQLFDQGNKFDLLDRLIMPNGCVNKLPAGIIYKPLQNPGTSNLPSLFGMIHKGSDRIPKLLDIFNANRDLIFKIPREEWFKREYSLDNRSMLSFIELLLAMDVRKGLLLLNFVLETHSFLFIGIDAKWFFMSVNGARSVFHRLVVATELHDLLASILKLNTHLNNQIKRKMLNTNVSGETVLQHINNPASLYSQKLLKVIQTKKPISITLQNVPASRESEMQLLGRPSFNRLFFNPVVHTIQLLDNIWSNNNEIKALTLKKILLTVIYDIVNHHFTNSEQRKELLIDVERVGTTANSNAIRFLKAQRDPLRSWIKNKTKVSDVNLFKSGAKPAKTYDRVVSMLKH